MTQFQLSEGIEVLERTPTVMRALLGGLSETWLAANEGPDTFNPYDNVGHLIHGERADWIARATIILAQGQNRTFEKFDRFAQQRESAGKTLAQLLDEFASLRTENLKTLRSWNLGERELALEGNHPAFGAVSLRQLLSTWVTHDLGHIAQTVRVMAKRYRDDIGPWKDYLPIVTDRTK